MSKDPLLAYLLSWSGLIVGLLYILLKLTWEQQKEEDAFYGKKRKAKKND